jgi:hypothetical protein
VKTGAGLRYVRVRGVSASGCSRAKIMANPKPEFAENRMTRPWMRLLA